MTVRMKRTLKRLSVPLLVLVVLSYTLTFWPAAGQEDDQQRDIEAKEVLKGRRQGKNPTPKTHYYYQPKLRRTADRPILVEQFPTEPLPKNKVYMTIGVTLWRVRVATEAEDKDPKITKERMTWDQQEHSVVVTRISDESPVPNQELLQMSIEYLPDRYGTGPGGSNQAAYLYVINREQFPDGSLRNARLIFPTLLTHDGDNRVLPGKTVTLPDPARPFRIRQSSTQAYETYTIIASPVPLDSQLPRAIARRAMELSPELVAKWEQVMGITEVRADLRDGVGHLRTQKELRSSVDSGVSRGTEDPAEDLTQDDLPPQTVFRKVAKSGAGMLVVVRLPLK